ncbi:MAG TPA: CehA/McbA family metallohydrolase [Bryobacteraceae bacterium]|nr:CehA/McbA family metallohydrolase [Bryobacteraceae bacterium]
MARFLALLWISAALLADELPIVPVEQQPFAAQVQRLIDALDLVGEPLLSSSDSAEVKRLLGQPRSTEQVQKILDKYAIAGVDINPESRVKATQGPAKPELVEQGWRTFLVKVHNQAGLTAVLGIDSPNAGQIPNRSEYAIPRRWMDLQVFNKQPMKPLLSGLEVEYKILQIYSRDGGKREAKLQFDVGQGSQDLGFRSDLDILFTIKPAAKVTLRVFDSDDKPTTAAFTVRDKEGRVYPSMAKRLAPDFFFHPQVYRADGESLLLPPGEYRIDYSRGPEYIPGSERIRVSDQPLTLTFRLKRWIDPTQYGYYSGDHHVHAAGCSHYEKPTEGVYPKDMMRHLLGEDLKVGSVLTWGPGWYFQKTFFEGKDNALSQTNHLMRYDVEVSGFPSSHTGHLVLLNLKEQDYPGTRRIEDWPSYGIPVLRWAKKQDAITGYAHSGWGLLLKDNRVFSYEMPPFDGIGANEYITSVTHGLIDFISTVDTPYPWELNIWYHTLNAGYRARISGETDFPCIYDERVGLGRSYVRQKDLSYRSWAEGIRAGANYVSDGLSHLIDFEVNGVRMGDGSSEVAMPSGGEVRVQVKAAAYLTETPNQEIRSKQLDQKPYWHLERARIGDTRRVPVELIANGEVIDRAEIEADGKVQTLTFRPKVDRSSWLAVRILPSSHTNPIFVTVAGRPIREKRSLEWCLRAVDVCWERKRELIRPAERVEALQAYEQARKAYRERLGEAQ